MVVLQDIVGGRYRLQKLIGEGGTSKVYLAVDTQDGQLIAVKQIKRDRIVIPGQEHPLLTEIRMQEKLYHPAFHKVWEEEEFLYVAMDYVEGTALDEVLREKGARSEDLAVDWAKQLCRALVYLHGFRPPVIYRDMKPGNIILQADGKLKLVDFGTAREFSGKKKKDTQSLGTPGYAAPEQYKRGRQSDVRTDIYCLGVTMYHILTGHDPSEPPYRICSIREWNRSLSPQLDRIVRKCTAKNPRRRYQCCEELLKDLETYRNKKRGFCVRIFDKIRYKG